jgi:anti-sigma B factor antagonist
MGIQRWSQDVIFVDLPPQLDQHELRTVLAMLRDSSVYDVVVDFSPVQELDGAGLAQLQEIQRLVYEKGHKLTLCGLAPALRGVFAIARLDDLFEFAEDRFTTLASPQLVG